MTATENVEVEVKKKESVEEKNKRVGVEFGLPWPITSKFLPLGLKMMFNQQRQKLDFKKLFIFWKI